jgi:glycosyltransferase involved in cell wall biosynthesis
LRILTFSTLYPSEARPSHGIFVENRLKHLMETRRIDARVMAPVPWFPFRARGFGEASSFAKTPKSEVRCGISVAHPRYPLIPKIGMNLAPFFLAAWMLPSLRRLQEEWDFDLIDAHYFYPDGVAAILLGRALGKPVTVTARGTDINLIPRYLVPRRLIQMAADRAAAIITVSQALKDALALLGVPPSKITVLRNGVDLDAFRPVDRESVRANLGITGKILLSVGHLIERKGHHLVISALPHLTGFNLVIAGDGPERGRLKSLARELGVSDRLRFTGAVPHTELYCLYGAADALVLASSREGWPNVLLEAMACGTPVVATAVWGTPEVVSSPAAGVLMESRSVAGVVAAVNTLFQQLPDRNETRAFAERFSWDETSAGQLKVFERVVDGVQPCGPERK